MSEQILSMQQIVEANDVTEKTVPVPEWGGSVVVKSISHRLMRDIKRAVQDQYKDQDVPEDELEKWIFIKGMVQPEVNEEEYEIFLDKSYGAMQNILMAIMGNSKTGDKAVTEAEKSDADGPVGVRAVSPGGNVGEDSRGIADRLRAAPEPL